MKHLYNRYGHPHRSLECLTVVRNPESEVCTIISVIFNEFDTLQPDGVNLTRFVGLKGLKDVSFGGVNFSIPVVCNINVMNSNDLTTLRAAGNIPSKNPLKRVVH